MMTARERVQSIALVRAPFAREKGRFVELVLLAAVQIVSRANGVAAMVASLYGSDFSSATNTKTVTSAGPPVALVAANAKTE